MIKEIFVFGYIVTFFGRFHSNYKAMNTLTMRLLNKINIIVKTILIV